MFVTVLVGLLIAVPVAMMSIGMYKVYSNYKCSLLFILRAVPLAMIKVYVKCISIVNVHYGANKITHCGMYVYNFNKYEKKCIAIIDTRYRVNRTTYCITCSYDLNRYI